VAQKQLAISDLVNIAEVGRVVEFAGGDFSPECSDGKSLSFTESQVF